MSQEFDIIVAGGGLAGLTAGLFSARLGHATLVLTGDVLGGHLLNIEKIEGVPGWPEGAPGFELLPITEEQAADAGAEFATTELTGLHQEDEVWQVATGEGDYSAKAVIVATGTKLRALGVPGEEEFRGKGVSQCASCDAPLMRDQIVAVVGGGDSAMQEALTLVEHVAKVIMVHRGAALSGQKTYCDRVTAHDKIDIRYNMTVAEILGADTVTGVRVQDAAGGGTEEIDVAGVFAFIGLEPNSGCAGDVAALDSTGGIVTDTRMRTARRGLLAAGSVRGDSLVQAASVAGDGATAAMAAHRYLTDGTWSEA